MTLGNKIKQAKSRKAHALQCATQGWPVIPLHSPEDGRCSCLSGKSCYHPGKHPRTLHGSKNATADRAPIKAWWGKWPRANIGIATGSPSGIFALDIDGKVGKASLKALQEEHGPLPKTVTVKTGRGRHLYFCHPGCRVGNTANRLARDSMSEAMVAT